MNASNQLLFVLQKDCDSAELEVSTVLRSEGYLVLKTFDLHSALLDHKSTPSCSCQMAVLMIYPQVGPSTNLILDGDSYETAVYLVNDLQHPRQDFLIKNLTKHIPGTLLAINPLNSNTKLFCISFSNENPH